MAPMYCLSFIVDTVGADDLEFRLNVVNGNDVDTEVGTYTTSAGVARTFQEVMSVMSPRAISPCRACPTG